jgi:hypothetical protein
MDERIWAKDLPPFDENARCRQCGHGTVDVIYHEINTSGFPCQTHSVRVLNGHLCRVCARCGYGWPEATVNASPAAEDDRAARLLRMRCNQE